MNTSSEEQRRGTVPARATHWGINLVPSTFGSFPQQSSSKLASRRVGRVTPDEGSQFVSKVFPVNSLIRFWHSSSHSDLKFASFAGLRSNRPNHGVIP
jgi:hypothetical protein